MTESHDLCLLDADLQIFQDVDAVMSEAVARGDPRVATRFGYGLYKGSRLQGVALAKLLWDLQDKWSLFQVAGVDDSFINVVTSEIGVEESTVSRYVNVWESIFMNLNISEEARRGLLGKSMRTLLLLPGLAHDEEEGKLNIDWDKIVDLAGFAETRKFVRDARGLATSSATAVMIQMDVRTGQLSCRQGEGRFEPFGLLNLEKAANLPAVRIAIERIIRECSIQEV
jgi:hypothetical protein